MGDLYIPEEFVIIGAAIKLENGTISLQRHVSSERIKEYLKTFKLPITYDEVRDFHFVKETDDGFDIISQPPLNPMLIKVLINGRAD